MNTTQPPSLKQRIRDGLQAAAARTRLCSPGRAGSGATILMYHSIADGPLRRFIDPAWRLSPSDFDRQCAWLVQHREVVSLSALVMTLREGGQPAPGSVVLTFDDGYLDNLEIAAPILARYGLPATLFLPTDYIDRVAPQWVDRLYSAFRMRRNHSLELRGRSFDLRERRMELAAYHALSAELIAAHDLDSREQRLDEIESELGAAVRMPRLTLDWDDVKQLIHKYPSWEIGAHGAGHLDLSAHFEDAVQEDVSRCLEVIERNTGRVPDHFSFPYGRSNESARGIVADMGLVSAVASVPDVLVAKGTDLYCMGRIDAGQSLSQIAFWTAGGWSGLPVRSERAA